jgi:hypothetical protein
MKKHLGRIAVALVFIALILAVVARAMRQAHGF